MKQFSIIIPMYNMGSFIGNTLEAFTKQTYKDFRIIVVDDGSTDDGAEVVHQWMKRDILDIEYVHQTNQGVSAARNNGIEHSKTPYLLFCDADDLTPYNALANISRYIQKYDAVAGLASRNPEEGKVINETQGEREGVDFLMNKFLFNNVDLHFCSFAYKKSILDENNIRFSRDLKYGEDEELTWKYLCHCKSAVFLETPLYCYLPNPNSASHKLSMARTQVIDSMIRVSDYYKKNNHSFYNSLETLGIPRAKLAILKQFAANHRKDLYEELVHCEEYKDYRIKNLLSFPDTKIKLVASIYLLSPSLCYTLLSKLI